MHPCPGETHPWMAKKHGPVTIITLCKNLKEALADDPLVEDVYYLDKYHKKLLDIFNLSKILKQFHFQNLLIYYPSLRLHFAAKIAGIENIWSYKSKNKKNLHLVKSAKELTENFLNIDNCLTETNFFIDKDRIKPQSIKMGRATKRCNTSCSCSFF